MDDPWAILTRCMSCAFEAEDLFVGRTEERQRLQSFLAEKTGATEARLLVIGGNPGSGKTALVRHVLSASSSVDWLYFNALMEAETELEDRIAQSHALVAVLDEADALGVDRIIALLSSSRNIRFIAIANTLDLAVQLEQARSGTIAERLSFAPYDVADLRAILEQRLGNAQTLIDGDHQIHAHQSNDNASNDNQSKPKEGGSLRVDPKIIELIARKTASAGGDVRRCLQLMRAVLLEASKAASDGGDNKENKQTVVVEMRHALRAPELNLAPERSLLGHLPLHQRLVLTSLLSPHILRGGAVTAASLYGTYEQVCRQTRLAEPLGGSDFLDMLGLLASERILRIASQSNTFTRKPQIIGAVVQWTDGVQLVEESRRDRFAYELRQMPLIGDYFVD
jgi:Cdc6-like AAA superfamily ATPase